jgi:hypothetical protein
VFQLIRKWSHLAGSTANALAERFFAGNARRMWVADGNSISRQTAFNVSKLKKKTGVKPALLLPTPHRSFENN